MTRKVTGAAAIAAVLAVALASSATARPEAAARPSTAVIQNGSYGVLGARGEYIVFTVRNRRVRNLNFNMQVTCQASDSPTSEQRFFGAGADAPQGRKVPSNGKLVLLWQERGEGRLGQINVELKFGVRDVANMSVIVPEERTPGAGPDDAFESCDGATSLRFNRGFELAPMPLP